MYVEFAIFDGDALLLRGCFHCEVSPRTEFFTGLESHQFTVTHCFEEPACPIEIECRQNAEILYAAALRMGVHDSEVWESVDLGGIHTFAFRCSDGSVAVQPAL